MKYNLMENALGAANWMKWDNDVVANNEAEQDWKWANAQRKISRQKIATELPWNYLKSKLQAQW